MNQSPSIANLAKKMVAATGAIDAVTKSGRNQKQGYNYVKAADVANEVRKVLVAQGIAFFYTVAEIERWEKTTNSGGSMFFCQVTVECTFVDAESGESFTTRATGWGSDTLDKAPFKAVTGALKYALRMTFLIPDEEDPEKEHAGDDVARNDGFTPEPKNQPQTINQAVLKIISGDQAAAFRDTALATGWTKEQVTEFLKSKGFPNSGRIPSEKYEECMKWARGEDAA